MSIPEPTRLWLVRHWNRVIDVTCIVYIIVAVLATDSWWWLIALFVLLYVVLTVGRVAGRRDMLEAQQ